MYHKPVVHGCRKHADDVTNNIKRTASTGYDAAMSGRLQADDDLGRITGFCDNAVCHDSN
jgi:hypothetical protein